MSDRNQERTVLAFLHMSMRKKFLRSKQQWLKRHTSKGKPKQTAAVNEQEQL